MRSVDRVFKFIDLPSEEPLPGKSGGKGGPDLVIDNPHARDCWPNRGQMDVQGLTVKYTEAGRAVLSDISFSVDGGQSVSLALLYNLQINLGYITIFSELVTQGLGEWMLDLKQKQLKVKATVHAAVCYETDKVIMSLLSLQLAPK